MSALDTAPAVTSAPPNLGMSAGEIQVVAAFARGHSPARAAQDLRISLKTVETRIRRMCARLGMPDAPHAVLVDYAYRYGHLSVGAPREARALSPRTLAFLRLLARGLGMRAIAAESGISRHTARQYRRRLLTTLGANSVEQAVAIGWQTGLLHTDTTTVAEPPVAVGWEDVLLRRTDTRGSADHDQPPTHPHT